MRPYSHRLSSLILPILQSVQHDLLLQESLSDFKNEVQSRIDKAQAKALEYGYASAEIDAALFALVAWVDETVMTSKHPQLAVWRSAPLQRHYFQTHNAGVVFYERLASLTAEQTAAKEVFALILLAGFRGQKGAHSALETQADFQHIIDELTQKKVLSSLGNEAGLFASNTTWQRVGTPPQKKYHASLSVLILVFVPILILAAVYFYLDFSLTWQVSDLIKQVAL